LNGMIPVPLLLKGTFLINSVYLCRTRQKNCL